MTETTTHQLMINNLHSQIMQDTFNVIANIGNSQKDNKNNWITSLTATNSFDKLAYAVEGDSKYKQEIDSNSDGIITYDEYVKYVTENISSKYNIPKSSTTFWAGEDSQTGLFKFSVTNMGRILSSYLNNSTQFPAGIIEQEA